MVYCGTASIKDKDPGQHMKELNLTRPRCALLLDRHVHKTGGTTMRNIFLNNECRDGWIYVGYGLGVKESLCSFLGRALMSTCAPDLSEQPDWKALLHELQNRNSSALTPLRVLAEVHYPAYDFHPNRLEGLVQQRERLRDHWCVSCQ